MRLLLVEDDPMIGSSLLKGLTDEGYAVDWVQDGASANLALKDARADYALTILDWNLPRRDGLAVLKLARAAGDLRPVLMITARDSLQDMITGLDGGADDYVIKPFALEELKARVRSLLRRRDTRTGPTLTHGNLTLDPATHHVSHAGAAVNVTQREFALLRLLMERPSVVFSRSQIEEQLYGRDNTVESNAVEFIIHSVRRKLGPEAIDNIRGVGWRLGKLK